MNRVLGAALIVILSGVLSCSDMPTAPSAKVVVTGNLTDRDGAALSAAFVRFRLAGSQPGFSPEYYARTDASGTFDVEMPEGIYEVNIEPNYDSGLLHAVIPQFKVSRDQHHLTYRFTGTKVSGNVTGPGGVPLDGAEVAAFAPTGYATGRTVSGHYSIFVPPGEYELYASPRDYDSGLPRLEIEATIGATDTIMDFALTGSRVDVTTSLGGATPLAGVTIFAQSDGIGALAFARTGVDGAGVFYLPDGPYSYTARPPSPAIVGPESGTWNIAGNTSFAFDFPATRWNITVRRSSDGGAVAFAGVEATEHGSFRRVGGNTDVLGKILLFVRPDVQYDFQILLNTSRTPNFFNIPNVSSPADSTFDILVNAPVP